MSLAIIYSSDFLSSINSNTVFYVEKMIDDIKMQISKKDVFFYEVSVYQVILFIIFHSFMCILNIQENIIIKYHRMSERMSLANFAVRIYNLNNL